jgi:hypothetical protein
VPAPLSSPGVVLDTTVALAGGSRFSLEWLAAVYAALFGLGAGVAAAAVGSRRRVPATALVVVAPLAPLLVVPWWSRFLVSTYGEPAGLLGAAWLAWGLLTVAVTRPDERGARITGLVLVAVGGVVAATAKPGFLPVGLAAVAACALVTVGASGWRRRVPGLVAAVLAVGVAVGPVAAGIRFQDELYAVPNTHDLVFTAILPESGPAALAPLGLPPAAFAHSGEHFYLDLGRGIPGWDATVGAHPVEARAVARRYVASHPLLLARMVHRGLVATLRPEIPYLVSTTAGPHPVSGTRPVPDVPEGAQRMGVTFAYFDRLPGRWVPPAVVALGLLAAAATVLVPRVARRSTTAAGLARVAGVLAAAAVGTVVLAVLGDGYVELAKHVWLASYLLVVTALALAGCGVAGLSGAWLRGGRTRPAPAAARPGPG